MAAIRKQILLIFISLLLFLLVFRKVGYQELYETVRQANLFWIIVSICLDPVLIAVSVLRWQVLIKSQGHRVSFTRLNALYLIGKFFNTFLPSTVGGDVVRGYEIGSYTKDMGGGIASVFIDRFTGFVMLVFMAIASFFAFQQFNQDLRISAVLLLSVVGLVGVVWLILDTRLIAKVNTLPSVPFLDKVIPKLNKFHTHLYAFKDKRAAIGWALLYSLIFMLLAIANVYTSAMAFHPEPISLIGIGLIVPILMIVSMLPISLNGIGIEDWAYVLFFSWLDLPAAVGLSTVLLIRGKSLILALLGGVIYPIFKTSRAPAQGKREIDSPNVEAQ
jgi:glycosyltransferase 2 family protein